MNKVKRFAIAAAASALMLGSMAFPALAQQTQVFIRGDVTRPGETVTVEVSAQLSATGDPRLLGIGHGTIFFGSHACQFSVHSVSTDGETVSLEGKGLSGRVSLPCEQEWNITEISITGVETTGAITLRIQLFEIRDYVGTGTVIINP